MKERIAKLIDLKSIITIIIIAVISYGFIVGKVGTDVYSAFAASIIAYYFTRKDS